MFKKKTKEQQIEFRVNEVFLHLTKDSDFTFTELETVQILNSVRRMAVYYLEAKQGNCMEQSVHFQQRAAEIKSALELIE